MSTVLTLCVLIHNGNTCILNKTITTSTVWERRLSAKWGPNCGQPWKPSVPSAVKLGDFSVSEVSRIAVHGVIVVSFFLTRSCNLIFFYITYSYLQLQITLQWDKRIFFCEAADVISAQAWNDHLHFIDLTFASILIPCITGFERKILRTRKEWTHYFSSSILSTRFVSIFHVGMFHREIFC